MKGYFIGFVFAMLFMFIANWILAVLKIQDAYFIIGAVYGSVFAATLRIYDETKTNK